jgi:hypothetical protein
VFEVGAVVDAGGEQDDRGIDDAAGRDVLEGLEEFLGRTPVSSKSCGKVRFMACRFSRT